MAVAYLQIGQLFAILHEHLGSDEAVSKLLDDLEKSTAYKYNQSFRETVSRLRGWKTDGESNVRSR